MLKKEIAVPLLSLTLGYLALPLLIFFFGWLKPAYGILASAPLLFCGWQVVSSRASERFIFRLGEILIVILIATGLCVFVGIGGYFYQSFDWIKHNAVLYDCVNLRWPVFLQDGDHQWPLVYYLAYYLPAALVGKFLGYGAAQNALLAWSAFGVVLTALWFAHLTRLRAGLAIIAFFGFAGMDMLASLLVQYTGLAGGHGPIRWEPDQKWSLIWQFPSNYLALEWSPGPAISAWLAAGVFLSCPTASRVPAFALLFTCAIFWSPLTAIGLGLLGLFIFLREFPVLSARHILPLAGLAAPVFILGAFFAAKNSPDVWETFGKIPATWFFQFHSAPEPWRTAGLFLLFVFMEFGALVILLRSKFVRDVSDRWLAVAAGLALLLLLPVTLGYFNDLAMRASAAPFFCLAVLAVRTLKTKSYTVPAYRLLCLVLLIGCLTPVMEIWNRGGILSRGIHNQVATPHQVPAVLNMTGADKLKAQYVGSTNAFFIRCLVRQ